MYVPLAVAAVLWARLGQNRDVLSLEAPWMAGSYGLRLAVSLVLGLTLAWVVVSSTPRLVQRTRWARALHRELAPIIDPLSPTGVLLLATASGLAEELFFRGAMQPVLGLLPTSLLFGAAHTGPKRLFLAWSLWALLMGLLFGLIFELTGNLWGPIAAHALINHRNMTYMKHH